MASSIKITGVKELSANLQNLSNISTAETSAALKKSAREIRNLARNYAPVDKHNLEKAIIDDATKKTGRAYSEYVVGVDESVPIPDRPDKEVGDYAMLMHEGTYNLGTKSQDKAVRLGVNVGPGYLYRAFKESRESVVKYVEGVLKRVANRYK
jgi:hypothetical protein